MKIECTVNGSRVSAEAEPRLLLSDFLRHELRLTGTHVGCEMGSCGACTVMVDGDAVRSCLMFAVQVDGAEVRTVEALMVGQDLGPIQKAFRDHHALQCGFCTSGILNTVASAARNGTLPQTEDEAREFLSGNICRCTGYQPIVDAILSLRSMKPDAVDASL